MSVRVKFLSDSGVVYEAEIAPPLLQALRAGYPMKGWPYPWREVSPTLIEHLVGCDCSTCLGDGGRVRVYSFSAELKVGDRVWVDRDGVGVECLVSARVGDQLTVLPVGKMGRPAHAPPNDPFLVEDELDGLHCPKCGQPNEWKGRTESQRLCGECRWGE